MDRSYTACGPCQARMLACSAACTRARCETRTLERMATSYNRLTIKRFPRVQERETAEARYWRNFTNPEVQVRGDLPSEINLARCCLSHPTLV